LRGKALSIKESADNFACYRQDGASFDQSTAISANGWPGRVIYKMAYHWTNQRRSVLTGPRPVSGCTRLDIPTKILNLLFS